MPHFGDRHTLNLVGKRLVACLDSEALVKILRDGCHLYEKRQKRLPVMVPPDKDVFKSGNHSFVVAAFHGEGVGDFRTSLSQPSYG